MRIAIATDFHSPWIGGPATFIDNFSAFLAARGHDVRVIAPSATGEELIEHTGEVAVWHMPTVPMPFGYEMRATARLDRVRAALHDFQPQVLQVHHPFPIGFAAMLTALRMDVPVVAVNHTIPECSLYGLRRHQLYPLAVGAFRRYLGWFLARATAICTPTHTAAGLLSGMGVRHPVEVISNGIDVVRFAPVHDRSAARRDLGLPDKPIVLYTGRLDAEKDMGTWLRAGARALAAVDAQLVVGGEGTDKPRLLRLVEELGIACRVTFPGYLPVEKLPKLYQAADVYCMTSAVELQSISTLEAMATGLPVVAARARALPELVADGMNGYLAAPGDVEEFASGLVRLLQAPARGGAMGAEGRKVAEQHSLDAVAGRHYALLRRVAEDGHGDCEAVPA